METISADRIISILDQAGREIDLREFVNQLNLVDCQPRTIPAFVFERQSRLVVSQPAKPVIDVSLNQLKLIDGVAFLDEAEL